MEENEVSVGYSQRTAGADGLLTSADCIGAPSIVATALNVFASPCYLYQRDVSTNFQTLVWKNTAAVGVTPVWVLQATLDANVVTKKVTLSSAQLLALFTTPIELIAAPGAGKAIEVMSVIGRMNFLTAAYATHTELDVIDATLGTVLFKDTSTILAATSTKVAQIEPSIASNAANLITANGAVQAKIAVGDPVTGAGSVDLYVTYKVVTL